MRKSLFFTILTMFVLYFLWWFSGGSIIGILRKPAPAEQFAAFIWDNFRTGAATIFEAVTSLLEI